jgi:hypothetical protein
MDTPTPMNYRLPKVSGNPWVNFSRFCRFFRENNLLIYAEHKLSQFIDFVINN